MRAFTTPGGLFVWLPQAAMWTRAKNGSVAGAEQFVKTTRWWAQIGGWIFFPVTLFVAAIAFDPVILDYIIYGEEQLDTRLLSPHVKNHSSSHCYSWNSWCSDYYDGEGSWSESIAAGVAMLSLEIAGWRMFYASYKDALKYGRYLAEVNAQ